MLTDYKQIVHYLLGKNLISAENIVANEIIIINASQRNSNFKIISGDGSCYFLKQDFRGSRNHFANVAYEADIYRIFNQINFNEKNHSFLPYYFMFDNEEQLLVIEGLKDSKSLSDHYFLYRNFSPMMAKELGRTVAALHKLTGMITSKPENIKRISADPPWIFFITQPDNWVYFNSSSANIEFVKILQQLPELGVFLEELRKQWKTNCIIHGDLKLNNCLVSATGNKFRIRIVDWELTSIGDARWDFGTILSEYLNLWISSIPLSGDTKPDQYLNFSRFPLKKMFPSIRAFYSSYLQHLNFSNYEPEEFLIYSVKYAAVRLIQTAFEQLQDQSALTNRAVCFIQVSFNILERPVEASVQLFDLHFENNYIYEQQPY